MPEFVRVREGDWEYTIPKHRLADGLEVLDKAALEPNGKPIAPKPVTPLGTPAAGSKQERRRAAAKKATARKRTAKKAAPAKTSGANSPGKNAGQTSATPEKEK